MVKNFMYGWMFWVKIANINEKAAIYVNTKNGEKAAKLNRKTTSRVKTGNFRYNLKLCLWIWWDKKGVVYFYE